MVLPVPPCDDPHQCLLFAYQSVHNSSAALRWRKLPSVGCNSVCSLTRSIEAPTSKHKYKKAELVFTLSCQTTKTLRRILSSRFQYLQSWLQAQTLHCPSSTKAMRISLRPDILASFRAKWFVKNSSRSLGTKADSQSGHCHWLISRPRSVYFKSICCRWRICRCCCPP